MPKRELLSHGRCDVYISDGDDVIRIASLRDVTVTESQSQKEVRGDWHLHPTAVIAESRSIQVTGTVDSVVEAELWARVLGKTVTTGTIGQRRVKAVKSVPDSSPYEISLSDLLQAGESVDAETLVVAYNDGDQAQLDRVYSTPSEGQYQWDADNTKLVFSASDAGKEVIIFFVAQSTGQVVVTDGSPRPCVKLTVVADVSAMFGCPAGTKYKVIEIPRAKLVGDYKRNFSAAGEVGSEVTFEALAGYDGTVMRENIVG